MVCLQNATFLDCGAFRFFILVFNKFLSVNRFWPWPFETLTLFPPNLWIKVHWMPPPPSMTLLRSVYPSAVQCAYVNFVHFQFVLRLVALRSATPLISVHSFTDVPCCAFRSVWAYVECLLHLWVQVKGIMCLIEMSHCVFTLYCVSNCAKRIEVSSNPSLGWGAAQGKAHLHFSQGFHGISVPIPAWNSKRSNVQLCGSGHLSQQEKGQFAFADGHLVIVRKFFSENNKTFSFVGWGEQTERTLNRSWQLVYKYLPLNSKKQKKKKKKKTP